MSTPCAPSRNASLWPSPVVPMVFVVANRVESGAYLWSKESGPLRSFANPPVARSTDLDAS